MKTISKFKALWLLLLVFLTAAGAKADARHAIWSLGTQDGTANEFALAPDGFRQFVGKDFGYEDKRFIVGASDLKTDFPYVLPGPVDTWGGTSSTAGWRSQQVNVLFTLGAQPKGQGYSLTLNLADYAKTFPPLVKVSVNGHDWKYRLLPEGYNPAAQKKASLSEPLTDSLSLKGDLSSATPKTIAIPLTASMLRKGGNEVTVSVLEGSWILFDNLSLEGPEGVSVVKPGSAFVRSVSAADYETAKGQPLLVDVEHISGSPTIAVELDGKRIYRFVAEQGRYEMEAPMPRVSKSVSSKYRILCDGKLVDEGTVKRAPQRRQTLADYVDTRTGTAHSRWMIAPGPWMPFSMVKLSPDNQNPGWQAGYDPIFENIGCFSHIHEWTLSGLGVMPTNGPLKIKVGDEQNPDEGYRSRIDKRTEKAGIGRYAVDLTDYGIHAELTATTRCGFERFTFPKGKGNGRVLIDLHPKAEYDFKIVKADVKQTSPTRIEGYCHQLTQYVWSNDADQDYTVHFVMEFDHPIKSMGSWVNDSVSKNISALQTGECTDAGLFVEFDTDRYPVIQIRSAISPVSVANASENLQKEVTEPFGWSFSAVADNQKRVWNDLMARVTIKTDDRLEKSRFYNCVYRSLCGRNTWSDYNGEWISTDGKLRKVANPKTDVMVSSDAYWNTFWNLNQFWNLVAPEWSGRLVRSQLSLYDANGWLGKGPAGLNYVPVMVAEHEIPLIVSAYQMGIRDFDAHKALAAAVKMQTTPAQKVFKGFAGNRDLATYMKHGYVPYDEGRFSNTMEYSFDDWTVGQLAKSLGDEQTYDTFNRRGYWWENAIDSAGYCHMRDSKGVWLPDFDPFRSGANQHYVEGNAWQLTFFVPQDVPALVKKIGAKRFNDRLLWGFHQDEAWRYNAPGDQYWDHPVVQGNQQSMQFAYLFNYAGQPWNTQRWSRSILDRYYGYGTGNAYLGDEDQGQMSAWAVMTAIGLFQMDGGASAEPTYEIGSPLYEETVIDLGSRYGRGKTFTIKAKNASRKNVYVQRAVLNGKPLQSFSFPAKELLKGGELDVEMGSTPNKNWGVE